MPSRGSGRSWRSTLATRPALGALERDAEHRGDWEAFAELLLRRATLPQSADESRQIRLHRAQILESRLGRSQDARLELEALLAETGDHLHVLTRLADLNERLGAKLRAAPLWLRASAIPKERAEAGELSRRACQSYLDGGDVESARRIFGEMGEYPRTPKLVALRVDIERRSENPLALSEALEEMALSSMEPPKSRAGLLVEAARAALVGGQLPLALGQAQRAARIARDLAEPQLFARLLEYRQRGAGTRDEATADDYRIASDSRRAGRSVAAGAHPRRFLARRGAGRGPRPARARECESSRAFTPSSVLFRSSRSEWANVWRADPRPERDRCRPSTRRSRKAICANSVVEARSRSPPRSPRSARKLPDRALEYLEVAAAMPDTRARALAAQTELRDGALGRLSDAPAGRGARCPPVAPRLGRAGEPEMPAFEATMKAVAKAPSDDGAVHELRTKRTDETPVEPVLELTRPSQPPIELRVRRDAQTVSARLCRRVRRFPNRNCRRCREPGESLRASAPPKPRNRPVGPRRCRPCRRRPLPERRRDPSRRSPGSGHSQVIAQRLKPQPCNSRAVAEPKPQPPIQVRELPRFVNSRARRFAMTPAVSAPATSVAPPVPDLPPPSSVDAAPPSPQQSLRLQTFRGASVNEETLLTALARGSIDAGRELMLQLENRSERTHDLVSICRRVAYTSCRVRSGDPGAQLYDSTLADRDIVLCARGRARARVPSIRKAALLEPPPLRASRSNNPIAFIRCCSGMRRLPRRKRWGSSGAARSTCSVAIRRATA